MRRGRPGKVYDNVPLRGVVEGTQSYNVKQIRAQITVHLCSHLATMVFPSEPSFHPTISLKVCLPKTSLTKPSVRSTTTKRARGGVARDLMCEMNMAIRASLHLDGGDKLGGMLS